MTPNIEPVNPTHRKTDLIPEDRHAEASVLASMMLEKFAIDVASEMIVEADFYREPHRVIFSSIIEMSAANVPVDLTTLKEQLTRTGQYELVGGLPYLASLLHMVPSSANVEAYAQIVRAKAMLRGMIVAGEKIQHDGYMTTDRDAMAAVDRAEQSILDIASRETGNPGIWLEKAIANELDAIDKAAKAGDRLIGLKSGFPGIDRLTGGWQPGHLIVVAGRPKMGKSSLALRFALEAAGSDRGPVAFFTLEMNAGELSRRVISMLGSIEGNLFHNPSRINEMQWKNMTDAAARVGSIPFKIYDSDCSTMQGIRGKCRRIYHEHKRIGLIVVDYIGLMSGPGKQDNRHHELNLIAREMKLLAGTLNCPVMLLSQLNREVEKTNDKRPQVWHLRETGGLEEHANMVILIHNPSAYIARDQRPMLQDVDIDVAVNRSGATGRVRAQFVSDITLFRPLADDMPEEPEDDN